MFLRAFRLLLLALTLSLAGAPAYAGTTYVFNGNAVTGCTLSKSTYTCPNPGTLAWDDAYTINSGYTVNVSGSVTFGYNNVLTMSGSAKLSVSGNLDISGINTPNLKVSGGTLVASGTFSAGAVIQTFTADVQAATLNLGTGSTLNITGTMSASGTVNIASNTTINGNVVGATVTTNAPVKINGDVLATSAFTLASGSTVNGDVGAGTLTLQDSEAIINGNAVVQAATLGWHGQVTETIYCVNGTRKNQCDCVTNNSGYPVNSANGPSCSGPTTSSSIDHFVIGYDPTASVCAPATVTVTACANAACSTTYGSGANVTLGPTGQAVAIGSSGVAQVSVTYPQAGSNTLSLSGATATNATVCKGSDGSSTCKVSVSNAGYALSVGSSNSFYADSQQNLTIAALQSDGKSTCTPLFTNATRTVTLTCAYVNPTAGSVPVRLGGHALNSADDAGQACNAGGYSYKLGFNSSGQASLALQYADAGQVSISLQDSGAGGLGTASVKAISVPSSFRLDLGTSPPFTAGVAFSAKVTALNASTVATPNFGRETAPESATLSGAACQPASSSVKLQTLSSSMSAGVQTSSLRWDDTGSIDLTAVLTSGSYLGSGMVPNSATTHAVTSANPNGCGVGLFIPAYFLVANDNGWGRKSVVQLNGNKTTLPQYYAGEPAIKVTVTAMNALNAKTPNYTGTYARSPVLSLLDATTNKAFATSPGNFTPGTSATTPAATAALTFGTGVATWTGLYRFTDLARAPTAAALRVTDADGATSANAATYGYPEPSILLRVGRLRLANRFGTSGKALDVPLSAEYWTGSGWALNSDDSLTAVDPKTVAKVSTVGTVQVSGGAIANGSGVLTVTPAAATAGTVDVAIDLGNGTTTSYDCRIAGTAAPAAGMEYLRARDSCSTSAATVTTYAGTDRRDPAARATFGLTAPENKRVIHVREVYQ